MPEPFHLSLVVPDLEATKAFYTGVLGCRVGRDRGSWIDVLLFGHQLTFHQEREGVVSVAVDHFGPVLSKPEWLALAKRVASRRVSFQMEPLIQDEGAENESGKFILVDPANNILEFKYYGNFHKSVGDARS